MIITVPTPDFGSIFRCDSFTEQGASTCLEQKRTVSEQRAEFWKALITSGKKM